ncbi:hypothetical protein EJB05_07852, partial [Eragrostis curvula]
MHKLVLCLMYSPQSQFTLTAYMYVLCITTHVWKSFFIVLKWFSGGPLRKMKPESKFAPYVNKVTRVRIFRTDAENLGISEGPQTLMVWPRYNLMTNEVFLALLAALKRIFTARAAPKDLVLAMDPVRRIMTKCHSALKDLSENPKKVGFLFELWFSEPTK